MSQTYSFSKMAHCVVEVSDLTPPFELEKGKPKNLTSLQLTSMDFLCDDRRLSRSVELPCEFCIREGRRSCWTKMGQICRATRTSRQINFCSFSFLYLNLIVTCHRSKSMCDLANKLTAVKASKWLFMHIQNHYANYHVLMTTPLNSRLPGIDSTSLPPHLEGRGDMSKLGSLVIQIDSR